MKTTDTTYSAATFHGWALMLRLSVMLVSMCAVFCVRMAQAYADIGSITVDGDTTYYSSLRDLAFDLQWYNGKTITVDMLDDWNASYGGEREFDYGLSFPMDCTATFNMHGHIFDRDNVYDGDAQVGGELIGIAPGTTLTINGISDESEKRTHDRVHIFTDVEQESTNDRFISVDGAVLTGGNSVAGAGCILVASGADVTINDVTIAGCIATNDPLAGGDYSGYGGAIMVDSGSMKVKMKNCTITGCLAEEDGGAIYLCGWCDNVRIELDNTHIDSNFANSDGGGIYIEGRAELTDPKGSTISGANGSTISNNKCEGYGGGVNVEVGHCTLKNLTITNNTCSHFGGGVFLNDDFGMNVNGGCVIRDNEGGNLTLGDGSNVYFNQSDAMDVHIGCLNPPEVARKLGSSPELDYSSQLTADDDGYEVLYTYRDKNQDDGRCLYYAKKSEEGDDHGHHRLNPQIVTVATQDIHATSDPLKVYAGGHTADEGGSGTRYQMRKIVAHHTSGGDKDIQTYYTDGFFFGDPIIYNEHIATASYGLAMSGAYLDGYEYMYKHAGARQYMADIGCPDQMIYVNDSNTCMPGTDTIGVTIGSKVLQEVDADTGELENTDYVLIAIAVRGANYEKEWTSNVTLGDGSAADGEAQGFSEAADQVMEALEYYIARFGLTDKVEAGKVKFWVSGFSRAGATSNITGKRIIETYCEDTVASVATGNEVFAYPLEAPKGGTDRAELLSDKTQYYRIHNLINVGDFVPLVAPQEMGFKRYGVDHYVPGTRVGATSRDDYLKQVKTSTLDPKRASEESGITSVTTYRDNDYLSTKKEMNSTVSESYDEYQKRRDQMVKHLAMIDHTLLFNDYFYPYGTIMSDPYYDRLGDFDGAKLEDYLANLMQFLQQEACYDRDRFATIPIRVNGKDYSTLQEFARAYMSTTGEAKKKFDDLKDAAQAILNDGLWTKWKVFDTLGDYYSLSDEDQEDIIKYLWDVADEAGVFNNLPSDEKDALKSYWFTLCDTLFNFTDGDWDLGDHGQGSPPYPAGVTWVNGSIGLSGSKDSNNVIEDKLIYALTLMENVDMFININHSMEVCCAWARTYDSYFADPDTGELRPDVDYVEYKAHWVTGSSNPDNYEVGKPQGYVRNTGPSAKDPYRKLTPTDPGGKPQYNVLGDGSRILFEVGQIHDDVSPADVTQGKGDTLGEAIYYTVYEILGVGTGGEENLRQLSLPQLYRGGVDLPTQQNSGGTFKVLAYAKHLGEGGMEPHGSEAIYYFNVGHSVTIDDGSGTEPVHAIYESGESVTISAARPDDTYFERWSVELFDEGGNPVEADIAEAILGGRQTCMGLDFTMPDSGDEYAEGKTYPEGYGLNIRAVMRDRVIGIIVDGSLDKNPFVPEGSDEDTKNYLAGRIDVEMRFPDGPWQAWFDYWAEWSYEYMGETYAARAGDLIYADCTYTATIVCPQEYVSPEEEREGYRTILFAPTLSVEPGEKLAGKYKNMTVKKNEDGDAVVTVVFDKTGGDVPPPMGDYNLSLMGVDDSGPEVHEEELAEGGFVRADSEISVTATAWAGHAFDRWTFEGDYGNYGIEPVEGQDLRDRTITVRIGKDIPEKLGDTLKIFAVYKPVISEMAAVVEAPAGGEPMQVEPVDTTDKETLKIKLADEWYVVHPDCIDAKDGTGSIAWTPAPLPDGTADYGKAYTVDLRIVAKTDDEGDYIELKREGTDTYERRSADLPYSVQPTVTMNGKVAQFDPEDKTLGYQFPKTPYVLKKVFAPSDVTGLPYGTPAEELSSHLPATTNILLEGGTTMIAPLTWGEPEESFVPADPYALQVWKADGTTGLPEGVENPKGISLNVSVRLIIEPADPVGRAIPSVEPGRYWEDNEVTLSSETEGASIYWTLDPYATDVVEDVPDDQRWNPYHEQAIEIRRQDATEDEIGPDGKPTGRKQIRLRTAVLKDGMRPDGVRTYKYVFANEVQVPEDSELTYVGRPQVGVSGSRYYTLEPLDEGVMINADGDAQAMDPGTYRVRAKIADGFRWEIVDPDTGEVSYTTDDQTIAFEIVRQNWWVRYDPNGIEYAEVPRAQEFPEGKAGVITPELPRAGALAFMGWATDPDAPVADYQPGDTLPYDSKRGIVVLYALWELDPAQRPSHVTFVANGLVGAKVPEDAWVSLGSTLKLGKAVAPLGGTHVFCGWSEDHAAIEPEYRAGEAYTFGADTRLYAVWEATKTMTLTFEDSLPDAAAGMPGPITVLSSMSPRVRIPSQIPQKSGRDFDGWNTQRDGQGDTYAPGSCFTLAGDATLWAQWKVAEDRWFVAFDANGGQSAPGPQEVKKGQDATLTQELPKNGSLTFKGWATAPDAAEAAYHPGDTLSYEEGRSYVVLYALWQLDPVQRPAHVTFDANGLASAHVPVDAWVSSGSTLTLTGAMPPLGGTHVFRGWSTDHAATEPEYQAGESYPFLVDTTLYAVWGAAASMTLTFDDSLADPVSGMPDPITVTPSMSPRVRIPSDIPQKSGRAFVGWNTERGGGGGTYAPGSYFTLAGDATLWAQWDVAGDSWYVAFDANGGQSAPGPQVVPIGEAATLTQILPKNGSLTFRGWATSPDSAEAAYQPGDTLPYEEGKSYVVLFALWQLDPVQRPVHVTYDANGLAGAKVPANAWVQRGDMLELGAAMAPLGGAHVFRGWSADHAATEPEYRAGESYAFDRDTTLYAVWGATATMTLTFVDPTMGPVTGMPEAITVTSSMSPRVRIPSEIPQKSGRAFVGWNTEESGGGDYYAPGSYFTLAGDATLWAQWAVAGDRWFVAFDANGGQSAPSPQSFQKGRDATLTKVLPKNGSLTFRGWATAPDSAEAAYQPGDTLLYEEGISYVVLYALWQLDPVQRPVRVAFDANGGLPDSVPEAISVPRSVRFRLPEDIPSWDAQHVFLGWSADPAAQKPTWTAAGIAAFDEDTTLYAVWRASYKVVEGAGSVYVKGSGATLRFVADGDLGYFRELRIDGNPVTEGAALSSGSTIADVSARVTEALSDGAHTITFVYMDGEASAGFSVQSTSPPGGDVPPGGFIPPGGLVPPGGIIPPSGGIIPGGGTTPSSSTTPAGGTTSSESVPSSGTTVPTEVVPSTAGSTSSGESATTAGATATTTVTPATEVASSGGTTPTTGDDASPATWVALLALAGMGLALTGTLRLTAGRRR